LRVARGEELPIAQHDVRITGHAIEVRLCAEDPADAFCPAAARCSTGGRSRWRAAITPVATGLEISPYYDSMLAKLIVHGTSRAEALDRLALALDRTVLLGVASNRAFSRACCVIQCLPTARPYRPVHRAPFFPRMPIAPRRRTKWRGRRRLAVRRSRAGICTRGGYAMAAVDERLPLPAPWRLAWQSNEREGKVALSPDSARVECSGTTKSVSARRFVPPATTGGDRRCLDRLSLRVERQHALAAPARR